MSESGDYEPAPWARSHDFKSARATYDQNAGRSYAQAQINGTTASDLLPASIETLSPHPILVRVDQTGSMGKWPGPIFAKMGYMDHELRTQYLGKDYEISFGAICDTADEYPLQVQPFVKGEGVQKAILDIVKAGGGGGSDMYHEAYGLAGLYDIHNVKTPKSLITPPLIIIGDEMPGPISKTDAENLAKVSIENQRMTADAIFKNLMQHYSVYLILKPYGDERLSGDKLPEITKRVYERWEGILGASRIALLSEADRVVDVIFGILAQETNQVDYFKEEIEGRQTAAQVKTVYKSLETVHNLPAGASKKMLRSGKSTLLKR